MDDTDPTDATDPNRTDDGTNRRRFLAGGAALLTAATVPAGVLATDGSLAAAQADSTSVTVRIENVSTPETLKTTADGEAATQPVPLSPGAYAVHAPDEPIFTRGEPERSNGLEEVAEGGRPGRLASALSERGSVVDSGAFASPVGADGPGPLVPGAAYEFEVTATPGRPTHSLSFVTMFIPSNDAFYAIGGETGMPLFADGSPVEGTVTDRVALWDAGTEVNEEPGVGANQVQRQRGGGGSNVGLVERGTVAPMAEVNGYDYPAVGDVLDVTVTPGGGGG